MTALATGPGFKKLTDYSGASWGICNPRTANPYFGAGGLWGSLVD